MINHKGTVQLETEHLVLRRFVEEDVKPMYNNWASVPEVTKFVTWFPHKNIEETQVIVKHWVEEYSEPNRYQWAIVLKEIDEPIGSIGVVRQDDKISKAEMGYCIGNAFWHKGYTSEALSCVMEFLFNEVGFNRIAALHDVRNPNSGRVMMKCGMQFEGTHREAGITKEGDKLTYSIYAALKNEWKKG